MRLLTPNRAYFAAALLVCVSFLAIHPDEEVALSREATIRAGIARDVALNKSKGRIALVSSLRWAPLPTLLQLCAAALPGVGWSPRTGVVVAAVAVSALAVATAVWLRRCGLHSTIAYCAPLIFFLIPAFRFHVIRGSSSLLFVLLSITATTSLLLWLREGELRHLAECGISCGLLPLTRFQGILFLIVFAPIVALRTLQTNDKKSALEATLLTFALPFLYAFSLWLGSNWLIMNNPVFFLRGLAGATEPVASPLSVAFFTEACEWDMLLIPLALIVPPGFLALLGSPRARRIGRLVSVPLGVALAVWAGWTRPDLGGPLELNDDVNNIVCLMEKSFAGGTFVVSGYRGYEFLEAPHYDPSCNWVHSLHLDWRTVMSDYHGNEIYVLVPRPKGEGRWEEVQLMYPHIWKHPPEFSLYEYYWADWLILACVEASEPLLYQIARN